MWPLCEFFSAFFSEAKKCAKGLTPHRAVRRHGGQTTRETLYISGVERKKPYECGTCPRALKPLARRKLASWRTKNKPQPQPSQVMQPSVPPHGSTPVVNQKQVVPAGGPQELHLSKERSKSDERDATRTTSMLFMCNKAPPADAD